jgi:hypothetical protein
MHTVSRKAARRGPLARGYGLPPHADSEPEVLAAWPGITSRLDTDG